MNPCNPFELQLFAKLSIKLISMLSVNANRPFNTKALSMTKIKFNFYLFCKEIPNVNACLALVKLTPSYSIL